MNDRKGASAKGLWVLVQESNRGVWEVREWIPALGTRRQMKVTRDRGVRTTIHLRKGSGSPTAR